MVHSVRSEFSSSFQLYFSDHGCLVGSVGWGLALEYCGPGLISGVSMWDGCQCQVRGCFFCVLGHISCFPPIIQTTYFNWRQIIQTEHKCKLCVLCGSFCQYRVYACTPKHILESRKCQAASYPNHAVLTYSLQVNGCLLYWHRDRRHFFCHKEPMTCRMVH